MTSQQLKKCQQKFYLSARRRDGLCERECPSHGERIFLSDHFVGILSQIKLPLGPLVIQLVWYILKQLLFTSVSPQCREAAR